MAKRDYFSQLSKIGYPIFQHKLTKVIGSENLPRSGGYIIASNHVDWLDGFFIATAVGLARQTPVYFITKSKYYWWTSVIIQIPRQKDAVVDEAVRHLRLGKVICIFPEGQRNPTKKLLPGKTGVVRMAVEAGVPIVPVGMTCTFGRNVGKSVLNLLSSEHPVSIAIGQPISIDQPQVMNHEWLHHQTQRVMKAIGPLAGKNV